MEEIVFDQDMVRNWTVLMLDAEIEDIRGMISNESIWEKGFSGEGENPHTQNIVNLKKYLSILEEHKEHTFAF